MDRFSTKIILSILLLRFRKSEQVREELKTMEKALKIEEYREIREKK